ncbi:hypothetical protein QE152_g9184 [Popillia japonica]|uniref:Uncharacterized protein n=1 Tax=Popillia japonica TaxID=7064 RepID=A0AAW1LVJ2_POPJA
MGPLLSAPVDCVELPETTARSGLGVPESLGESGPVDSPLLRLLLLRSAPKFLRHNGSGLVTPLRQKRGGPRPVSIREGDPKLPAPPRGDWRRTLE